jgi:hypothetical protein
VHWPGAGDRVSNVVADPDRLRDLARKLKAAGAQIESLQNQLAKSLNSTGWRDRERDKFEQALSPDLKALSNVARRLQREHPMALERKARALDEFKR